MAQHHLLKHKQEVEDEDIEEQKELEEAAVEKVEEAAAVHGH